MAGRAGRRFRLAFSLLASVTAAAQAAPAVLTELPLEELLTLQVYSASKFVQKLSEAPSAVTVITAAEIKTFGWRTLADILGSVRGLYTSYDRNYSYLGARGFLRPGDYNTRFLLLVDGHRLNDAVYDQASIGTDFVLDVDLIERVEFVHGPGSSLHGPNAFFGVINVITRGARLLDGKQVTLEAGSAGQRKLRASVGLRAENGTDLLFSATTYRARGRDLYFSEFDAPASNNGIAAGLDHDRTDSLFLKATRGPLSITLAHNERRKGVPTASFQQVFNDSRSRTIDGQSFIDLGYRTRLDAATELVGRLYWGRYAYEGDYVYDYPPVTVNRDRTRANWLGSEMRITSTAIAGHKLVFGAEYQRDYRRHQLNDDVAPAASYLDSRRRGYRWGAFVQDEVALADDLLLNAGLRYDRNEGGQDSVNPRIGLIYQANPATSWKAIYATAFRAPNAYELYYDLRTVGGQKANPALGPERIRSAEIVVEHHLAAGTRLSASLFRNQVTGLISQTLDPNDGLLIFQNIDRVHAQGLGVQLEKAWRGGARLRSSLTLQRARDAASGAWPVNSPRAIAKFNLSTPVLGESWRAGIEAQYLGRRRTLAAETSSYWLASLTLTSVQLAPGVEAGLSVYNLFNRRYADPAASEHLQDAIAQDGRSVRVRVALAF